MHSAKSLYQLMLTATLLKVYSFYYTLEKPRLRGFKSFVPKPNYGRAQVYSHICVEIDLFHTPGQHIFITKIKRPCLPTLYPSTNIAMPFHLRGHLQW